MEELVWVKAHVRAPSNKRAAKFYTQVVGPEVRTEILTERRIREQLVVRRKAKRDGTRGIELKMLPVLNPKSYDGMGQGESSEVGKEGSHVH